MKTYDTTTERTLDADTGGLVSQVTLSSARERESIDEKVRRAERRKALRHAKALVELYRALDAIPKFSQTVYVDGLLCDLAYAYEAAVKDLKRGLDD